MDKTYKPLTTSDLILEVKLTEMERRAQKIKKNLGKKIFLYQALSVVHNMCRKYKLIIQW